MKFVYIVYEYKYREGGHVRGVYDSFFKAKQFIDKNYSTWDTTPDGSYRYCNKGSVRIEQYELE